MKISGRKMFVFVLLTVLFSAAVVVFLIFSGMENKSGVLIAWFTAETTLAGFVVGANMLEKNKRIQTGSYQDPTEGK
jgi:hypothetical protein